MTDSAFNDRPELPESGVEIYATAIAGGCPQDFPPAREARPATRTQTATAKPSRQAKKKPEPMQFMTRAQARALPVMGYKVTGLIPNSGVGQIYSNSGCGKSFTLMQLCHCLSEGWQFCGRPVKRCAVYYFHLEGDGGLPKRLAAFDRWMEEAGKTFDGQGRLFYRTADFNIDDADMTSLAQTILANGDEGAVVIIDTQAQATAGKDENSSQDMGVVLKKARSLAKAIRGVVLLVHHTGKDATKGGRGSSVQRADFDFQIEAQRDGDTIYWQTAKERDEADDQSVRFKLKLYPDVVQDEDGKWQSSCVAVPETDLPEDEQKTLKAAATKGKGGRMSDRTRNALRVFDEAIRKHGKAGRMHESVFREAFLNKVLVDTSRAKDPNDTKRKAYYRELDKLMALKIIEMDGEWLRYTPEHVASEG